MGELLLLLIVLMASVLHAIDVPSFLSAWIILLTALIMPVIFNILRRRKSNNIKDLSFLDLFEWPDFATKPTLE